MPTYRGSATLRFTAGGRNFVLESPDCSAHVRQSSEVRQLHGTDYDPGRWTVIGVFDVRAEEEDPVRTAFLTQPPTSRDAAPVFNLSLLGPQGAGLQGQVVAKRMEEASRGALLLTLTGLALPTVV